MDLKKTISSIILFSATTLSALAGDVKEFLPEDNLVIRYKNFHDSELLIKPFYSTDIVKWVSTDRVSIASKDEVINEQNVSWYWIENDNVHVTESFESRVKNYYLKGPLRQKSSWSDPDGIRMTVISINDTVKVSDLSFEGCLTISILFSDDPNNLEFWTETYAPNIGLIKRKSDGKVIKEIVSYTKL